MLTWWIGCVSCVSIEEMATVHKCWDKVDVSKVQYKYAKTNMSGKGKSVRMTYENGDKTLVMQTPWCHVPFPMSVYEDENTNVKKHTLLLSMKNVSEDFGQLLTKIDGHNVDEGVDKCRDWFGDKKDTAREIICDRYKPILKEDSNEPPKYDAQFRLKLPHSNGKFDFCCFGDTKNELGAYDDVSPSDIESGCRVRALIEVGNLYIADKTFGQVLKCIQLQVSKNQKLNKFCFVDNEAESTEMDCDQDEGEGSDGDCPSEDGEYE